MGVAYDSDSDSSSLGSPVPEGVLSSSDSDVPLLDRSLSPHVDGDSTPYTESEPDIAPVDVPVAPVANIECEGSSGSDMDSIHEQSDSTSSDEDVKAVCDNFCKLLLTSHHKGARATDIESFLSAMHSALDEHLPRSIRNGLPSNWYQVVSTQKEDIPSYFYQRDACVNECQLFQPSDGAMDTCPSCAEPRFDIHGHPRRVAYFSDIAKRVRDMWGNKLLAQLAKYPTWEGSRAPPGDYRDCLDGTLLNSSPWKDFMEESEHNILFQGVSDAVQLTRWPMRSYTPYVMFLLNFPPWVRHRIGATWLVAVFPENSSNDQIYFEEVNRQLSTLYETGVQVHDASTGQEVVSKCMLAFMVNDYRGVPKQNLQKQAPAHVGACKDCDLRGVPYYAQGTQYMGAVQYLSRQHPLRLEWRREFADIEVKVTDGDDYKLSAISTKTLKHLRPSKVKQYQRQKVGYKGTFM